MYSDSKLQEMNQTLRNYAEHLRTGKYTSKDLWMMKYGKEKNFLIFLKKKLL